MMRAGCSATEWPLPGDSRACSRAYEWSEHHEPEHHAAPALAHTFSQAEGGPFQAQPRSMDPTTHEHRAEHAAT
jgi:hypothetical protein